MLSVDGGSSDAAAAAPASYSCRTLTSATADPPCLVLLNSPHLRQGTTRHDLPPSAPSALLVVLGAHGDWVARDRLTTLFWPDAGESDAQHHLRVTLHRARQLARGWGLHERLLADRRRLRLDLACDVPAFRTAVAAADWPRALALHQAPLCNAFSLRGFAALDDWLSQERESLQAAWRSAALREAARREAEGDAAGAAALLQAQLQHDLLAEDSLQALLRVAAVAGARDAALDAFDRYRRRARDELGLDPLPGTVLLAEALRRAEPRAVPVALPVAAPHAAAGAPAVPEAVAHPPLVGRDDDLAWLRQPGAGLWLLAGEPGVGKSRLVQEATGDERPDGAGPHWVRCRESLRQAPLQALVDLLAGLPVQRLQAMLPLGADRRELARLLPALAPSEVLAPSEPGGGRLMEVLAAVLVQLARAGTVVIDDLQWADPPLLDLLQRVLTRHPVRLLATLRPLQAGDALQHGLDGLEVLGLLHLRTLNPLPAEAVQALLARLSGRQAPRLAAWLHRRSGGNPFFALETLRALFESGRLASGERGWMGDIDTLGNDDTEPPLPPRVAALVRQRLAGLSETAQRVLSVAAVAGDAEALDALAEGAGLSVWATAEAVAAGQAAGLLKGRRFAHDLVHEALLAATPEPLRAVLHAGLARRLAQVLPPHCLAAHWWAAGDESHAVQATLAAARLDADRGLHDAAEDRLQRARDRATDSAWQARLDVARAAVARQAGRLDAARALADAALAALPMPDTRRDALLERYELAMLAGDLDEAERHLALARVLDDASPALLMAAGKLAHARGDYAGATAPLQQLADLLRRQRPGPELAAALTSLATTLDSQGLVEQGVPLHEEAMAIAHRLGARYVEVEAASNRVWSLDELGRLDEAIAVGEHAMALGDYDATPYLLSNLAYVYLRVQRLDDAERAYRRLSQCGDASIACVACGKLADVAARRGDTAARAAAVQAALGWLSRTQVYTAQVSAMIAVLRHGDEAQARAALAHRRPQAVDPGLQQRLDEALHARGLA